jgi:hypothetical protein
MNVHSGIAQMSHTMLIQSSSENQEHHFDSLPVPEGINPWGYLDLGIDIRGVISVENGRKFLEADLSQPKLNEARNLTTCIGRLIESVFDLESGAVEARLRYVDLGHEMVRPQASFGVVGKQCPDKTKLIEVLSGFAERIVPISGIEDIPSIQVSEEDGGLVDQVANDFLEICGGKRIGAAMQIVVDQKPIATLSRAWCSAPKIEDVGPIERTLEAFYDGRRLRSRIMFVIENSNQGKSFDIFYEEERFDETLRSLGDNKRILLKLLVKESRIDKNRVRYELVSFQRIEPPSEFVLC